MSRAVHDLIEENQCAKLQNRNEDQRVFYDLKMFVLNLKLNIHVIQFLHKLIMFSGELFTVRQEKLLIHNQ